MSQWRGMAAPGSKPHVKAEGLVPRLSIDSYTSPAISLDDLRKRGWTIAIVQRHLGDEDRRDAVTHWANFSGKKMYLLARVEMAEASSAFAEEFARSAQRRRLSKERVDAVEARCAALKNRAAGLSP
jgi:hypothetical protein